MSRSMAAYVYFRWSRLFPLCIQHSARLALAHFQFLGYRHTLLNVLFKPMVYSCVLWALCSWVLWMLLTHGGLLSSSSAAWWDSWTSWMICFLLPLTTAWEGSAKLSGQRRRIMEEEEEHENGKRGDESGLLKLITVTLTFLFIMHGNRNRH